MSDEPEQLLVPQITIMECVDKTGLLEKYYLVCIRINGKCYVLSDFEADHEPDPVFFEKSDGKIDAVLTADFRGGINLVEFKPQTGRHYTEIPMGENGRFPTHFANQLKITDGS